MQYGIVALLIFLFGGAVAQTPLVDRKGTASFFSEAPLENIEAKNTEVTGAINLADGTVAVTMLIKGFHFDKSLMEEHFNENYLESEKFPKATFKGVISSFSSLDFTKEGAFEAEANGEFLLHGVKKPLNTKVQFNITQTTLGVTTKFNVALADFEIRIPRLVFQNIAEVVEVKSSFNFARSK